MVFAYMFFGYTAPCLIFYEDKEIKADKTQSRMK